VIIFRTVGRLLAGLWAGLTLLRRSLANLLLLLLLVLFISLFFDNTQPQMPARSALLVNPTGTVVDQLSYVEPVDVLLGGGDEFRQETLLRDIFQAIELAADDPAIVALVLELDALVSVGLSKSQELGVVLQQFRQSGKPVIAVGDYYSQDQYALASQADEIIMHPMGAVALQGYSSYRNYYREALEKIRVTMHVFKAGEHKSMAEPWLRDDMSAGERKITDRWLHNLWRQYTDTLETNRSLPAGSVSEYVNGYVDVLTSAAGDSAQAALSAGLVDKLMDRGERRDYLASVVGAIDAQGSYQGVAFDHYLAHRQPLLNPAMGESHVAVVTAQGSIMPGEQPSGTIGGDSLARLLRAAASEPGVEALVLRVNSGGGSVFASEIIRREIGRIRHEGMPVVVSMGAVAASGGYYIAAEADQVWATPATITGSIGVFAAFPTFEKLLDRAGVSTDGVGTTALAGSMRADKSLNKDLAAVLQQSVSHSYQQFVQLVADGREMDWQAVDDVAQGRVWSAEDALDAGLIDRLGYLNDAVEAAAGLAHLDDYSVEFYELPLSPSHLFTQQLVDQMSGLGLSLGNLVPPAVQQWLTATSAELSLWSDPRDLYVRCVACSVP
jgi:protease IV